LRTGLLDADRRVVARRLGREVKDAGEAEVMIEREPRSNRNRLIVRSNDFDSNDLTRAIEVNVDGTVVVEGLRASNGVA
jgi:hypothetical protein